MLVAIHPKLPMRNKKITKEFYCNQLGFTEIGATHFAHYLMIEKESVQLHFFEFKDLNPYENYGQVYIRTDDIDNLYQTFLDQKVRLHPNGNLELKPWGIKEFSILDADKNLLTFGEVV